MRMIVRRMSQYHKVTHTDQWLHKVEAVQDWFTRNNMTINPKKTKDMWDCFNTAIPEPDPLLIGSKVVERVNVINCLVSGIKSILNGTFMLRAL